MSRRPALTTQADIARAIRAAQQCGAGAVEIIRPDVTIRISIKPVEPEQSSGDANEWDSLA